VSPRAGRRVDTEYMRSKFETRSARNGSRFVRERSEARVGLETTAEVEGLVHGYVLESRL